MERYHPDCIFCQLCNYTNFPDALHTPLVYEDSKVIVVIDAHRKQYKERYLLVTKFGHFSQEELPQEEWDYLIEVAHALGKARVWKTKEKYAIDTAMQSPDHVHIQVAFS